MLPRAQIRLSRPGWVAATAGLGFVLVYVLFVQTELGQRVDDAAMAWVSDLVAARWAELTLGWLSAGSTLLVWAALGVVTAGLLGPVRAILGGLAAGVTLVLAEVAKLELTRPELWGDSLANSFPSGHVAVAAGLAAQLLLAVPGSWRQLALVGTAPLVALIGLATVALEWHRPSDVVGSILLAVAVGGLAVEVLSSEASVRQVSRGRLRADSHGAGLLA